MRWQVMLATGGHFDLDGSNVSWARPDGSIIDCGDWSNRRTSEFLIANAVGGFDTARLEMLRDRLSVRRRKPTLAIEMGKVDRFREGIRARLTQLGASEGADGGLVMDPDGDGIQYSDQGNLWFVKVFGTSNVLALCALAVWVEALAAGAETKHELHVVQDGVSEGGKVLQSINALECIVALLGFDNALTSLGPQIKEVPELAALQRRICTIPPLQRAGTGAMRQVAF